MYTARQPSYIVPAQHPPVCHAESIWPRSNSCRLLGTDNEAPRKPAEPPREPQGCGSRLVHSASTGRALFSTTDSFALQTIKIVTQACSSSTQRSANARGPWGRLEQGAGRVGSTEPLPMPAGAQRGFLAPTKQATESIKDRSSILVLSNAPARTTRVWRTRPL